jgi:hypothetical protein
MVARVTLLPIVVTRAAAAETTVVPAAPTRELSGKVDRRLEPNGWKR